MFGALAGTFRDEAQLLIVSHQKRTMEAADCLFGVTMQPGGSSISYQRLVSGDNASALLADSSSTDRRLLARVVVRQMPTNWALGDLTGPR